MSSYSKTIKPVYMPIEQVKNMRVPGACGGISTTTVPVSGNNS
jgi:hypothetical protein